MNRDVLNEKDILELFNYISIEDKENEDDIDLKMDDLRKKRLRKNLMKQIKDKNSSRKFRYKAAAVAVAAIISVTVAVPAVAKNIPSLKSIIQALDGIGSDHGEYEKYSKVINKSVTDNGITLTINEVLCDDSNLMIGYTIKSDSNIKNIIKTGKDIIEMQGKDENFQPFKLISSLKVSGKQADSGSDEGGKYLDNHTYINSETMNIGNKNLPSVFNVDLNVKNIYKVKGNWSFKFSVSKDEILKNTKVFNSNTTIKYPYGDTNVEKVRFTPINTSIKTITKYNEEYINSGKLEKEGGEFNWFVFDDKGNEIEEKGLSGNMVGNSTSNDFENEFRFVSIKNIPKYLMVIPYRMNFNNNECKKYKNPDGSISIPPIYKSIDGVYPIDLSQGNMGKLIIKEIKLEKDRTIVRYTVQGKAPFLQAKELYILDNKNQVVEMKNNNFSAKRYRSNSNDYTMEFQPLNKNKKYKIGTNNLSGYEIRNDLKFKINITDK